jgi:flagellin
MSLSIKTNHGMSMLALSLGSSMSLWERQAAKLASGLRINGAKDDPAGLVISEQLRSQIGSLEQEIENTRNLITKYETADATLMEARSHLNEIRSMAVAASNEGFYDEDALAALNSSAQYLQDSFNNVIETADYNNRNLFDGGEGSVADVTALQGVDLSSAEAAQATMDVIDERLAELDTVQGDLGARVKNDLESTKSQLQVTHENLVAAESQLRDADMAVELSATIQAMIQSRYTTALMAHANNKSHMVLSLFDAMDARRA